MGKQISLYLDEEVIGAVESISEEQDRSLSFIVNEILKEKLFKGIKNAS